MSKIFLVIRREFITRVRKKSFIIMTLLGPLLFAGIMVVPIWLATRESTDERTIEVIDESNLFKGKFDQTGNLNFIYTEHELEEARQKVLDNTVYGLLYIPDISVYDPSGIVLYTEKNPSLDIIANLERTLEKELENIKLGDSGINREVLESLQSSVNISTINISESGEKQGNAGVATGVGYFSSLLIYFFIFLYGAQVMRGVIEEKNNRIVEIIISSVRPFQLMMGKIIGVASVGLAQFLLWILLTMIIFKGVSGYFNLDQINTSQTATTQITTDMSPERIDQAQDVQEIMNSLNSIDIFTVVISFIFYFLGGYFLYGALFAAVGSAADSDTETQQFMLPITIPLILSIVVLGAVLKEPDGSLAFWMSMIPFTSPIVMMMRIPFGVPIWQLLLSMALLILGFVLSTWAAGKIYRIGILMHGAKVNYKVLGKWLFMKN
ncbi:MAG: ABC transporter permease [Candidatus Cyclobacteriaceae bacterium M3_2C_046]